MVVRFVQQQEFGLLDEQFGETDELLLSARKRRERQLKIFVAKAKPANGGAHAVVEIQPALGFKFFHQPRMAFHDAR